MALTEWYDLKLLVGTILPEDPKPKLDIDKLLKREEMLKKEREDSDENSRN